MCYYRRLIRWRDMLSDSLPLQQMLLLALLSSTVVYVSTHQDDRTSRSDHTDRTSRSDHTSRTEHNATGSNTCPSNCSQLNCRKACVQPNGELNITMCCAMRCSRSMRTCTQETCMSQRQECAAICAEVCNQSNLGNDQVRLGMCFQQCDPDSNNNISRSVCERIAIMNCRRARINNDTLDCARRCRRRGNCRRIIRGILDGNFTDDNIDSAISMIRMFSRRRTNRVPLGLDMRLESVEMLNSALMRRRRESIRTFRGDRRRREEFLQVFDEVLDDSEQDEWRTLQDANFSQNLLRNIETAVELVTSAVQSSRQGETMLFQFPGNNLVMDVECVPQNTPLLHQLLPNASGFLSVAAVQVEVDNSGQEEEECSAVVSAALSRNLEEYITQNASNLNGGQTNTHLVTLQVSGASTDITNPVQLFFTPIDINMTSYLCVFWNFDERSWSSENITTEFNGTHYICNSTHLTTFAVLVDVTNNDENFSDQEKIALQVVSYIGCGISIFCLCLAIFFLVLLRKTLDKGALLYIHINLAIALLAALVIFVAGIETAKSINWLCIVVAALLHYSFLSVFFWMLAEGIILYYMLVRVFSTAGEKWYYLLILGWGVPVPIVATAVGITHEYYHDESFCWLSVDKGVIWAFAGPVILIILVNTILLIVTVISIVRVRRKASGKDNTQTNVIMTAVKGTIILLPLLGMTWILGFLSLDSNSTVFAWLFTIFNSLQGCFIFILHVARNDKVIAEVKKMWRCFFKTTAKEFSDEMTKSTTAEEKNTSNGVL